MHVSGSVCVVFSLSLEDVITKFDQSSVKCEISRLDIGIFSGILCAPVSNATVCPSMLKQLPNEILH